MWNTGDYRTDWGCCYKTIHIYTDSYFRNPLCSNSKNLTCGWDSEKERKISMWDHNQTQLPDECLEIREIITQNAILKPSPS